MRITKADLIRRCEELIKDNLHLRDIIKQKDEIISAYKRPTEALTIALEKTTDAVAHVVSDLRAFCKEVK